MLKNNNTPIFQQNLTAVIPSLPMSNYRTLNPIGHQEQFLRPQYLPHTAMKRIVIIGSSGSGKSTLARHLGTELDLQVFHLDRYFWQPGWVETPNERWEAKVTSMSKFESWIMDGNYRETLDLRLKRADSVVFMDLHPLICSWQAMKRRIVYRNHARPDMADGCVEKLFDPQLFEFIRHIWQYPYRAKLEVLHKLQAVAPKKRVIWLRSRKEVQAFLLAPLEYPAYLPNQAIAK